MSEKKRGGGPKTPRGKANSSKNSTKHGVRSKNVLILPGEEQEDYDKVVRGWNEQWEPADYQEEKLVETLIRNDWLHRRAQRWQLETEARVVGENGPDPMDWTAEQQHKMELMQRYKTTAEGAFYRAWSALRGLGKDILKRDKDFEAMRLKNAKHELREAAQKLKEKESVPRSRDAAAKSRRATKAKKVESLGRWATSGFAYRADGNSEAGVIARCVPGTGRFWSRGRQIQITDPRPQETLKDPEPLAQGFCLSIRGTLKHLLKSHGAVFGCSSRLVREFYLRLPTVGTLFVSATPLPGHAGTFSASTASQA